MSEVPRAKRDRLKRLVGHAGREARVAWLVKHWEQVRHANLKAVALMMLRDGLYSPNTGITDIVRPLWIGNRYGPGLMDRARSVMLRNPRYVPNAPRQFREERA